MVSNLARVVVLVAIGGITVMLFRTRDRHWVGALRLGLVTYAFLTLLKLPVDAVYFPQSTRQDLLSLAFPFVWFLYFSVSRRVRRVFWDHAW